MERQILDHHRHGHYDHTTFALSYKAPEMHLCLQIDEILVAIARYQTERKDLAAMAVTCKTFYGPAIGELWSTVDDIRWLLRLLPAGVVQFSQNRTSNRQQHWVRLNSRYLCSHRNGADQ